MPTNKTLADLGAADPIPDVVKQVIAESRGSTTPTVGPSTTSQDAARLAMEWLQSSADTYPAVARELVQALSDPTYGLHLSRTLGSLGNLAATVATDIPWSGIRGGDVSASLGRDWRNGSVVVQGGHGTLAGWNANVNGRIAWGQK